MGEFILSVAVGSPGFQAILMQRELSLLPFFCGKRKVGKPIGNGAQKNGLPCEIKLRSSISQGKYVRKIKFYIYYIPPGYQELI